jgi:hypothetical protein
MESSIFKKLACLIFLGCLLIVIAACTSTVPLWETNPVSPGKPEITTVADILANPDKYDGNMVQVGGWVSSLQFVNAKIAYTSFHLGDQSGKTIPFVSLGILSIKDGDFVSVTAKYNKSAKVIWIDSIEGPKMERK